jgi:hypothetical protein
LVIVTAWTRLFRPLWLAQNNEAVLPKTAKVAAQTDA